MDTKSIRKMTNARGKTRRTVMKGAIAGGLATLGLAAVAPFEPRPRSGRREQMAERCLFAKERSGRHQSAVRRQNPGSLRQSQPRRTGDRREWRCGADLGDHHAAERHVDCHRGFGKSVSADGELHDPGGHLPGGRQPVEDGEDQQGHRAGRSPATRCSARPKRSKSRSAAAAADPANRQKVIRKWHRQFAFVRSQAAIPPRCRRWFNTRWIPASSRTPRAI